MTWNRLITADGGSTPTKAARGFCWKTTLSTRCSSTPPPETSDRNPLPPPYRSDSTRSISARSVRRPITAKTQRRKGRNEKTSDREWLLHSRQNKGHGPHRRGFCRVHRER